MPAWLAPSLHSSFYLQVTSLEQFFLTTTVEGRLQESGDFCHTHLCTLAHSLTLSSHSMPFCQSLDSLNASFSRLQVMLLWAPSSHPSGASSPLSNSRLPWVPSRQSLRWCRGLSPSHGASRVSSLPLSSPGPPWPGSFRQPPSCPHKLLCLCQLPCSKVPSPPLQPSQPRVTPPGQVHRPTSPGRKWEKKCLRISRWPSLRLCPPASPTSPPSPAPQRPSPVTSAKSEWHRIRMTVMTLTSPSWTWHLWLLPRHRPTHVSVLLWRHKPLRATDALFLVSEKPPQLPSTGLLFISLLPLTTASHY